MSDIENDQLKNEESDENENESDGINGETEDENENQKEILKENSKENLNDHSEKEEDSLPQGTEEIVEDENQSANVKERQENQSARSVRSRQSIRSTKSLFKTRDTKDQFIDIESLEQLPDGCLPLFLSAPTLALFNIVIDEGVTSHKPLVQISKESLLADLTARAAVSDFSVLKAQIKAYEGTDILFAYDPSFKFGENFVFATTEQAKEELIKVLVIVDDEDEMRRGSGEGSPGQTMLTGNYVPPKHKDWVCLGSDLEILESHVVNSRPLIKTIVQRSRREFGTAIEFSEKLPSKDFVEVKRYEDNSFSLKILEQNKSESNAPVLASVTTNTTWPYPRNAHTQYEPRILTPEQCEIYLQSEELADNTKFVLPFIIESLQHNEIADYFTDDYTTLAPGNNTFDQKTDNDLKEFQTFADLKFGKEKAVTQIEWHPTIKGIIATSMAEKTPFDQRIDNFSKIILTKSYIILWSFLDPIQPQLLLEAPADIYCFKFNPTDPHYIAGGCVNGQLVLWDIESHMDDLRNVKAKMKSRNLIPLFSFDNDDGPKIPTIRAAAVSHCESSHSSPITDLKWLPDHYEVNNLGYSLENLSQKCVQIATAAGDNKINFWDIRSNKAVTGLPDKSTMGIPTPAGVPETFRFLDMKWKPTLRVHVYKTGVGGDYAPTRFSLKELHGDRRVLESLEDKENKPEDVLKSSISKGRTLQNVNTHIFVGTEDGDLVYVDWMPQKDSDTGKLQTPKPDHFWNIHDGPITCVTRCPFDRSLVLVVGGWIWSLWKEEVISGPILQSCTSAKPLTNGAWSPTKASVFFLSRADGSVEIWDILDKTHEPTLTQNISSSASLTSISIYNFVKKQLVAIGDINGGLHVYEVPQRFKQHSQSELIDTGKYIEREVKRRDFVQRRWNLREQEKIEKEVENKKKAGIAPQVILTEDEIKIRMKSEYDVFVQEEQAFLRELGLKEDEEEA